MKAYNFAFDDEPIDITEDEAKERGEEGFQMCDVCGRLIRRQDGWIDNFTRNPDISECIKCGDEKEE
jgi:hypothetical protein